MNLFIKELIDLIINFTHFLFKKLKILQIILIWL